MLAAAREWGFSSGADGDGEKGRNSEEGQETKICPGFVCGRVEPIYISGTNG